MVQNVKTDKKNMDVRLQYVLSLIVGFIFLYLCGFAGRFLAGHVIESIASVSITVMTSFLNTVTILFIVAGIILALMLYQQPEQKRVATNRISMLAFLALQVLLILVFLVFGRQIASLYIYDPAVFALLIPALRTATIPMVLFSIVSVALGIAVKRKSFRFIVIVDFAVFMLSLIVMFVSSYIFHWGVNGIAIGLGIIQPVAALLPNVGGWQYSDNIRESVPASMGIKTGEHNSSPVAAQMFCPQCGARFSAEKKFCDQCGTELKVLQQPDVGMTAPVNSNVQDAPSGGFAVLGFFLPLVGLILFLVWHDSYPLRAKSAGKGALAGFITGVVLTVLAVVIELAVLSSLF